MATARPLAALVVSRVGRVPVDPEREVLSRQVAGGPVGQVDVGVVDVTGSHVGDGLAEAGAAAPGGHGE